MPEIVIFSSKIIEGSHPVVDIILPVYKHPELTQKCLKSLEENGVLEKSAHPDSKAKIRYSLTQKGIDLLPILMEIYLWADKYYDVPAGLKATINEAKKDKGKFAKQLTKELKIRWK